MLQKCALDNSDIPLALLHHRNTPRSDPIGSPNQRLMSRASRTITYQLFGTSYVQIYKWKSTRNLPARGPSKNSTPIKTRDQLDQYKADIVLNFNWVILIGATEQLRTVEPSEEIVLTSEKRHQTRVIPINL